MQDYEKYFRAKMRLGRLWVSMFADRVDALSPALQAIFMQDLESTIEERLRVLERVRK